MEELGCRGYSGYIEPYILHKSVISELKMPYISFLRAADLLRQYYVRLQIQ